MRCGGTRIGTRDDTLSSYVPWQVSICTPPENARTRKWHLAKERRQTCRWIERRRNANGKLVGVFTVVKNDVLASVESDKSTLRGFGCGPGIGDFLKRNREPSRQLAFRDPGRHHRERVFFQLSGLGCSHALLRITPHGNNNRDGDQLVPFKNDDTRPPLAPFGPAWN